MLAFFLIFFFDALWHLGCRKSVENLLNKLPKISKKGGLGWFWGLWAEPLEAFGPQDGPKLKKHAKRRITTYPPGDHWGTKI